MIDAAWASETVDAVAVKWEGCDEAIVGIASRCGQYNLYVYDYDLLVHKFMGDDMTEEEAMEWVDYNIAGAWIGSGTPIILYRGPR
jgi:hypothetical protein